MANADDIVQIPVPLPHIKSVNAWLLRGDPLTLVDTGPYGDEAITALEAGLKDAGVRVEDIERVLVTHHHLDHSGLAATIAERSGARIGALDRAAAYGEQYDRRSEADRRFSHALMRHHGVPDDVIDGNEDFWDFIREASDAWRTDDVLTHGDVVRAGGRDLKVVARPGHSTTDTLFVDEAERLAFVGDHLLATISSNTEVYPALEPDGTRPRARVEYLEALRRTAAMPLACLLSGHGDPITDHADLVERRFEEHRRRCDRILDVLRQRRASAFEITTHLWRPRTVSGQPLLVVWEVLGHLDLLLDAGKVSERVTQDGSEYGVADFAIREDHTEPELPGGGAVVPVDRPARSDTFS
jgi:glyoxylase-like metal-dependent hydrolase (beta-lactamase superfamily II)